MRALYDILAVPVFCIMMAAGTAMVSCSRYDMPGGGPVAGQTGGTEGYGDTLRLVDIGLSVYWADRNVGADNPYAAGDYVGSEGMDMTSLSNLRNHVTRSTERNYWIIPSWEHVQELYDHCTFEEMYAGDGMTKVMRVTGPNGNCIYLPLAGQSYLGDKAYVNSVGFYIYQGTGSMSGKWRFYSGTRESYSIICSSPIRPIAYKSEKVAWEDYFGKVPAAEEAVDLGLSVKWAPWNIGADKPERYGGFYGWGDPTGKLHSEDPGDYPLTGAPGTVIFTDLAMAKWGTNWHTPTRGQMEELIDKCTWEWTQVTGTHGYRVTGPNGNSIFLPAGGYREGESRRWLENAGWYWTKTREDSLFGMRYFSLLFTDDNTSMSDNSDQWLGKSIRPVYYEQTYN